jgi:MSHA pilin protein MshD
MSIVRSREAGVSLIELIVFIVVVSIAVTGVLSVMNYTVAHSADPVIRKQAIAVAEGLLEEITAQAFTWCDPDDSGALTTATSAASCTTPEALGPETGETRFAVPLFDNVNDYNGFTMTGIRGVSDGSTVLLADFDAVVTVSEVGTSLGLADNTAALRIDVQVSSSSKGESITLTGYRYRHSPNSGG